MRERHLRRIGLAREHGLAEEDPSEGHAIETTDKTPVTPPSTQCA